LITDIHECNYNGNTTNDQIMSQSEKFRSNKKTNQHRAHSPGKGKKKKGFKKTPPKRCF
jgi:hypothetical protein